MIWIIHILIIAFFAGLLKKTGRYKSDVTLFIFSITLKLLSGIFLGFLYHYYYKNGDTFYYFNQSVSITTILYTNPAKYCNFIFFNIVDYQLESFLGPVSIHIPRSIFFIKILSLLNIFTSCNYWLNSLYLSFFCFAGSWKLYTVLIKIYPETRTAVILSFLLMPSVVFWSSGVLKESILLGSVYFCVAYLLEILQGEKKIMLKILWILFNLWLLFNLKVFVFAIFVPIILSFTIASIIGKYKTISFQLCVFSFSLILMLWMATTTHYALSLDYFMYELIAFHNLVFRNTILISNLNNGGLVYFNHLTGNILSIAKNAPQAIFNGLFMPLHNSNFSLLQMVRIIENSMLLILSLWSFTIFLFNRKFDFFKFSLLIYIFLCACIFGLASPNLGTLARYKVMYISFFVFIVLSNFSSKSIKKR